jgi:hypothetical protein
MTVAWRRRAFVGWNQSLSEDARDWNPTQLWNDPRIVGERSAEAAVPERGLTRKWCGTVVVGVRAVRQTMRRWRRHLLASPSVGRRSWLVLGTELRER